MTTSACWPYGTSAKTTINEAPYGVGGKGELPGHAVAYPWSTETPSFTSVEGARPNVTLNAALRCAEDAKPA